MKNFTMRWWEMAIFKLSLVSFGIIIGVYYKDIFMQSVNNLTAITAIGAIYIMYIWCVQQPKSKSMPMRSAKMVKKGKR